jgi:hypothetical protein
LIEALYQSKLHEKILIVERDDHIGGAWGTINLFNFADVEIGPHIIYGSCDNRSVYRFMSQFLGISMEPVCPGPVCVLSGRCAISKNLKRWSKHLLVGGSGVEVEPSYAGRRALK